MSKNKAAFLLPVFAGVMAMSGQALAQKKAPAADEATLRKIVDVTNFAGNDGKRTLQGAQSAYFLTSDLVLVKSDTLQHKNGSKQLTQIYTKDDVSLTTISEQNKSNEKKCIAMTLGNGTGSVDLMALSRLKNNGMEISATGMNDDEPKNVSEMCRQAAYEIVHSIELRQQSDDKRGRYRNVKIPGSTLVTN